MLYDLNKSSGDIVDPSAVHKVHKIEQRVMDGPLGTRQPVRSRYSQYRPVTMSILSVLLVFLGIGAVNAGNHCDVCVNGAGYCDPTWLPALNLNRALTGVDIAKKHPMPFKPEKDPSVKKILFNSVYRQVTGNMQPYDYIHLTDKLTCSTEFETMAWTSTEQYIQGSSYSSMSSWSVSYEGPTVSEKVDGKSVSMPPNTASFGNGNTETNDDIDYFFSVEKGSISHSQAKCSVYSVEIDIYEPSLSLHPSFIEAIKGIDLAKTENEKKYVMEKFIGDFGSHYASKSIMGVGVLFETRYTEEETKRHSSQKRNECSSTSGGFKMFGFGSDYSKNKCTGSLSDTTQGENTRVKRFTSTSYGTLPAAGSLSEWAGVANDMLSAGTLAPLPIQQDLRLILDLFATPAVANIVHNDGTKINVTNLFLTALDGYNSYSSHTECHVPACVNTVLIKGIGTNGIVFKQEGGSGLNGRPIYKSSENFYLHYSKNEHWIVSQDLSEIHKWKSSPCPQKGIEFQVTVYAIGNGPLPGHVNTWQECARKCFDRSNCKYWQHNIDTKKCSLMVDYSSAQATLANVATGTRDCPGDKSLFAHGLCVENMSSRSMWMAQGTTVFAKDIEVRAFDPTFLIIAGGYNGNNLNSVEIIGNADCPIPNLPVGNFGGNLAVTAGDRRVLYCGGWGSGGFSDLCYVLDVASGAWTQHSRMSTARAYSTAITMARGLYIIGGEGNGLTSDYLPKSTSTWQTGPNVPYNFWGGCGVRINNDEFVLIGGVYSKKTVYSYNVKTSVWTQRPDLIEERYLTACTLHTPTNSIIVAGGAGSSSTTEIIPLDTWRPRKAGDLKQGRWRHAMVTVGGKHPTVYAIGGYGGSSSYLSSVEVWDHLKAEWKMAPVSLDIARKYHAALSVPPSAIC